MTSAFVPITLAEVYPLVTKQIDRNVLTCAQKVISHDWSTLFQSYFEIKKPTDQGMIQYVNDSIRRNLIEYLRFMVIKLEMNDLKLIKVTTTKSKQEELTLNLAVSDIVDNIWHHHMLLPQDYHQFSILIGDMIEHDPQTSNTTDWQARYKRTYQEYLRIFKTDPPSCSWNVPCSDEYPCDFCAEMLTYFKDRMISEETEAKSTEKETTRSTEIFCKTLTGQTITLKVDLKNDTTQDLMFEIWKKIKVPLCQQRLVFAGRQLEPSDNKLSSYRIERESTIHMVLRLKGC